MYLVIDDVVPKETQDSIERILFSSNIPWIFSRAIAYKNNPEVSESIKNKIMGFTHLVLKDGNIFDSNIELYNEPLISAFSKVGKNLESIFGMRVQLQLPTPAPEGYGSVHVDSHIDRPYYVCLYYVNDSDGDTIIFKQTTINSSIESIKNNILEEEIRITPKKGRFVIMDGNIYHCGSKPSEDVRCVINYNVFANG